MVGTVSSGTWYKVSKDKNYGYVPKSSLTLFQADASDSALKVSTSGFTIKQGQSHTIGGTVESNYAITKITCTLGNQKKTITNKTLGTTKKVSIAGSAIDSAIKCGNLAAGTYTLTLKAWDSTGNTKTATATVTVGNATAAPKISDPPKDVQGGKQVTITQKESGATLWYKIGTQAWKSTTQTSVTIPAITTEGKTKITAYSSKGGVDSGKKSITVTVSKLDEPYVSDEQSGSTVRLNLNAGKKATVMYRIGSGSWTTYNGQAITLNDGQTISYYAKRNGYINSPTGTYTAEITAPGTPDVKLVNTENTVATGKSVTIGWKADKKATSYKASLFRLSDDSLAEEQEDLTEPTANFTLPAAGGYYMTVVASNDIGESEESNKVYVTAKDPLTVVFRDADTEEGEGEILNTLQVEYGSKLTEVDKPSRKGHSFSGWMDTATGDVSQNAYLNAAVREDKEYVATYDVTGFKVRLYDQDGELIKTKVVAYGEALNADSEKSKIEANLQTGYKFVGWQVVSTSEGDSKADITSVDSDMDVIAVVAWAEPDLPVALDIENVTQVKIGNSEYVTATVNINNNKEDDYSLYLVSALKAKDASNGKDKTVFVDRKMVELSAGDNTDSPENTVNLKIRIDDIKGVNALEVTALERRPDLTTGSTYSETKTKTVSITSEWDSWSEWSDTEYTASADREVGTRTVYSYRDKEYAYNGNDTLTGYTRESTEYYNFSTGKWQSDKYTKYGNYVTDAPTKSTNTTSSYKQVNSYVTTTAYRSYAYVSNNRDWYWTTTSGTSPSGQKTSNLLTVYSSKSLAASGYTKDSDGSYALPKTIDTDKNQGKMGKIYRIDYAGTARVDTFTSGTNNTWLWPHSSGTRTLYRSTIVRSRNKFWKWGSWSEWGENAVMATDTREVQTKVQYRYRDKLESTGQEITVNDQEYSFSGTIGVDTNLNGKLATVMVYQAHNTDPNKYQMQYVGQTTIGEGNSYDFSFVPREDPTVESGNYIVALGVQGTTGLINVGMIEAPKAQYTVDLFYAGPDETPVYIAQGITVLDHEDVDLTGIEIPEREGYVFMGWKDRTTDITADCVTDGKYMIEAVYAPKQYAVAFVDWINQTLSLRTAEMDEVIEVPANVGDTEGYNFIGWKTEDGTVIDAVTGEQQIVIGEGDDAAEQTVDIPNTITVRGNTIVTAVYEPIQFSVTFIGLNGETVDTQTVNYGEAAEPPQYTAPEGTGTFIGWSTDNNWWNVTEDVTVRASALYYQQAAAPEAEIVTDEVTEAMSLALTTEEENGAIYYTLDGTLPTAEMIGEYLESDPENYKGSIHEYTEPISIDENQEEVTELDVSAVTYADGKDVSDECFSYLEKDPEYSEYDSLTGEWKEVGEYEVKAKPGKDIVISINLEENPGITGYDFLVEMDRDKFYTDEDEYGEPIANTDELSQFGLLTTEGMSFGWRVNWTSVETITEDGKLFNIVVHVDDSVEEGTYPLTVSYSPSGTFDTDFMPTELTNVSVTIVSEACIDLNTLDVKLARYSYTYEGTEIEPAVIINGLKEGEDYTVEYADNINVGTAKAIVTGINDYSGTVEKEFTITQANIADAAIGEIPDQYYTGSPIEPELRLTYNSNDLVAGTDYEAAFTNNVNEGTAAVTITGIGNFKGTTSAEFKIVETLESQLEQALADLAAAEQALEEMEAQLAAAESAKEAAEQRAEAAEAALSTAQQQLEQAQADVAAAEQAKAELEAQLAECEGENEELEAQLAEANANLAAANAALEEAEDNVEALETELAEANAALEEAEAAMEALEDELAEANAALEEAENALAELQSANVIRYFGKSRFDTAIKAADAYKTQLGLEKFDSVIMACASNYADALAGSYLSSVKKAPILLVDGNAGHIALVQGYVNDNLKPGGTVYILGGTGAVPDAAVEGLTGFTVTRLSGKNRYDTNIAILDEAGITGDELLIASGGGFADSLSASATGKPILLVGGSLNDKQKEYIEALDGMKFCIIGGKGAVSEDIENYLKELGDTDRVFGKNRYETSVNVARKFFTSPKKAVLAYGENFPDGLCGGSLANAMGGPLILTADGARSEQATAYAKELKIHRGAVLGGTGLISDETVMNVFGLIEAE